MFQSKNCLSALLFSSAASVWATGIPMSWGTSSIPNSWQVPLMSGWDNGQQAASNGMGNGQDSLFANLMNSLLAAGLFGASWPQYGYPGGAVAAPPIGSVPNAAPVAPPPASSQVTKMIGDQNIYRFYNPSSHRHYYSRFQSKPDKFNPEGIAFKGFSKPAHGLHPVYHYYNSKTKDNYYTRSPLSQNSEPELVTSDYQYGEVLTFISKHPMSGLVPVYAYYSPNSKEHFYTINSKEIGVTNVGQMGKYGYVCKGILGYASPPY